MIGALLSAVVLGIAALLLGIGLRVGWEIGGILMLRLRFPLRRLAAAPANQVAEVGR